MTWTKTRLKHLCVDAGQYGLNISAQDYVSTGCRLIRTSDIDEIGRLRSREGAVYVDAPLDSRHEIRAGDLLLSRSGTIGRSMLLCELEEPSTYAGYLVRFRPRPTTEPRFMAYVAVSRGFQGAIEADAVTSTIQNFNAERYANIAVMLPPLDEQRRIADFLDAETARIDRTTAIREDARRVLIERRAAGAFGAVTGSWVRERVPSTLAWVDSLPVMWQGVKLGHVARLGSGHTPSRSKPEWWVGCTIPWITTGEVSQVRSDRLEVLTETREMISETGLLNSSAEVHPKGTVVLCRTAASAGYSAVMGRDMATSQDLATWTCGPKLDPFFLLWCLRVMRADLLDRLAMGSTHKTIYMPDLQGLRIPLPGREEQEKIVAEIRSSNAAVDSAVDAIDRQLALLAERRQALITAAVTGQLDVTTARGLSAAGGVAI
ncbi:restriction endonuclease subunit S [Frankia sp. Cppng1_Ct_nod]|uniref:restriction endonuclease subunit S n=1 Tax=Frankia sp. Cppng1_Ct_nod TaxID=2897162 RepID=UPI001A94FAC9|nr:restriction endonuclease subunit S [Frankia sp. Cppng1_Ct_nod]